MISVFYVLAIFYPVHQFFGYLMQLPVAFRFLFCRFLRSAGKQKKTISFGNQDFTVFGFSLKWCHQQPKPG